MLGSFALWWPLTSFKKVFCVSSSKLINSFITITSPVSWCVTLTATRWWQCWLKLTYFLLKCFEEIAHNNKTDKVMETSNCGTLTACPKQPLPSTSPWMRSEGLKMRWVRSTGSTRRDSERTMSLFWDKSDSAPGDKGHLSILQLRLREKRKT